MNDEIGYVMQTDPRFQISLPHLTRFPDAAVMVKVNKDLARELNQRRLEVADCLFQGERSSKGSWDESDSVTLLTRDMLSILRAGSNYCGGAHPDSTVEPLIYNLRTGRAFDLRDLFRIRSKAGIAKEGAVPDGPAYLPLFDLYLKHYVKPDGCEDEINREAYRNGDFHLIVYFHEQGMSIGPELSHATQSCGPEITVPYRELRGLIRDDSPFRSLVEKANV